MWCAGNLYTTAVDPGPGPRRKIAMSEFSGLANDL